MNEGKTFDKTSPVISKGQTRGKPWTKHRRQYQKDKRGGKPRTKQRREYKKGKRKKNIGQNNAEIIKRTHEWETRGKT